MRLTPGPANSQSSAGVHARSSDARRQIILLYAARPVAMRSLPTHRMTPLARATSARRSSGIVRTALLLALIAFSAAIGWATIRFREPLVPEQEIAFRPIQVAADGYVSSQTCKACHPSQYETWQGSFHRSMTQVAAPETVRADFDDVRVSDVQGRPMRLQRRGREFWAEFDDPDWGGRGDQRPRLTRQIVMMTGSHHQQVYWYRTDRTRLIGQLPGIYLIAEQRWIPRSAALLHPAAEQPVSETGRWNGVCVNCHTTHGKQRFDTLFGSRPIGTQSVDTTVAEFGIACEACHGPSEQHARLNRSPVRRYWSYVTGRPDPTTVQPALLDPKRSSQVCGQCHGVWEFYDSAGEQQANAAGLPYRPGGELMSTRFVVQPTKNLDSPAMRRILERDPEYLRNSFWPDGMVRVSGREYNGLIDSPCFEYANDPNRTLTCSSCHAMHKASDDPRSIRAWADTHQISAEMSGNNACLQCHPTYRANVPAHTKHQANSTGSECYNCHMPYTTYGLLKALRSHTVSSPTVAASVQTGRPNACNLCHLDKTLAWTSDYLGKWYGMPRVALGESEQTVAASLLWLLRGDAGQRALIGWSMGWQPAQRASGTSWIGIYLAQLLNDPYDAVRFIAYRSFRSLPGLAEFDFNFVAPPKERLEKTTEAADLWWRGLGLVNRRTDPQLLFDSEGLPREDLANQLGQQRSNRPVVLNE